ncbi:hypothetical protein Tco_0012433 [Tanacetum coccineum]
MTEPSGGGMDDQNEREGTPLPLTKEQINRHFRNKVIIKYYNRQNKADPIRLDFGTYNILLKEGRVARGKDVGEEDLSKPFKEILKTPLTRRIIEFAGPEYVMPTNITLYDGSTDPADHLNPNIGRKEQGLVRESFHLNSIMNGPRDVHQRLTFPTSTRNDRDNRSSQRRDYKGNDYKNPYKCPKEILATETQLQLPAPRPVANPLRTGDPDKYCDYHQDKGHHTNDCIQLRKQLEIALESGKLNHLMKDLRQRVGRGQGRNPPPPPKNLDNAPITFPGVISDDASDEPLIIEAEVEGYLGRDVRETRRTDLVGFAGEVAKPLGKIDMEVCFGNEECRLREEKQILTEKQLEVHEAGQPDEGADLTEQILVNPSFPDQMVTIGGLSPVCKNQLKTLLTNNMEVFAWEPADMTGVPRRIIEHSHNSSQECDGSWRMCIAFKKFETLHARKTITPCLSIETARSKPSLFQGDKVSLMPTKDPSNSRWQRSMDEEQDSLLHRAEAHTADMKKHLVKK